MLGDARDGPAIGELHVSRSATTLASFTHSHGGIIVGLVQLSHCSNLVGIRNFRTWRLRFRCCLFSLPSGSCQRPLGILLGGSRDDAGDSQVEVVGAVAFRWKAREKALRTCPSRLLNKEQEKNCKKVKRDRQK